MDLPSINILELKAIEVGIWLAINSGCSMLWIESDSKTAISWIKGKGNRPWSSIRILRSILRGLDYLLDWKVSHILREGNEPADILASFRSARGESIILPSAVWPELGSALALDQSGVPYTRTRN
ncbi:hypothetical protein QJS10_CPB15g01363 [Acorus calamus]|uniref:RNase H type-1 domain-containing protein n=1 Tax=Acorus calamus TaxID=4465 RepID=A0AAV9D6B8_ACOCL|nr:hypothetical protein QJS10_CPB15g01363 [Acorus calamus]